MTAKVREIPFADPALVFAQFARQDFALFFDSARTDGHMGRYSYIAVNPCETLILGHNEQPFEKLQEKLRAQKAQSLPGLPPFQGGAAGYFGYELGRALENVPAARADDMEFPDMAVGFYDQVIAFDMLEKRAWNFGDTPLAQSLPQKESHGSDLLWQSNFTESAYRQAVQKIVDYIHAGDIFQANLSQRFTADLPDNFDPYALYLKLRKQNPASFAAFMNFGGFQIASSSPERFLCVENRHVQTRPIKGTRPRGQTPREDLLLAEDLLTSEKDKSENAMIVDLLRNDLSRVCAGHSVKVPELCALESYATVHHLVSTVHGYLRTECDAIDLLKACFPGGSVTGAPKIRAMEIISEFEPVTRGPYCGAMGWIGFDDNMDTNITIRTLCFKNGRAVLQAGGGIVADSDPQKEYDETLVKARALFDVFTDKKGRAA